MTTWLADGALDVHYDAPDWCERRLLDIAPDAVQAITVLHPDGERIELRGFGVFQVKPRKKGIGRNPRTGREVRIPPGKTIRFKPGKNLRSLG